MREKALRAGYWSCVSMTWLCLLYGVLFGIACLIASPLDWYRLDVQGQAAIRALQVFYPSLLLLLVLSFAWVVFAAVMHHLAEQSQKLTTRLALMFSVLYALLVSVNYYVQYVVVRPNVLHGTAANLGLISQTNVYSVMATIDLLGYFFLGVAMVMLSALFSTGVRVVAILAGISCMSGVLGQLLQSTSILSASAIAMTVLPLFLFVALSVWMRKQVKRRRGV